jgi:PhnB protein
MIAPDEAAIRNLLERRPRRFAPRTLRPRSRPGPPEVVNFDLAPPLQYVGAEAHNPAGLRGWFDTWEGPVGYDLHDFSITAGDDLAYCHGSCT